MLIVGSAEQPTVFLTTSIEKLTEKDAEATREHMRRTIFFVSITAKQQGTGPKDAWTEELSPARAAGSTHGRSTGRVHACVPRLSLLPAPTRFHTARGYHVTHAPV